MQPYRLMRRNKTIFPSVMPAYSTRRWRRSAFVSLIWVFVVLTRSSSTTSTIALTPLANTWSLVRKYTNLIWLNCSKHIIFLHRTSAESYCNEIFPGRLYLGDWHHASDAHIIETLGITHILNITDSCENYLADSHRKSNCGCFTSILIKFLHYSISELPSSELTGREWHRCKGGLLANLRLHQGSLSPRCARLRTSHCERA